MKLSLKSDSQCIINLSDHFKNWRWELEGKEQKSAPLSTHSPRAPASLGICIQSGADVKAPKTDFQGRRTGFLVLSTSASLKFLEHLFKQRVI